MRVVALLVQVRDRRPRAFTFAVCDLKARPLFFKALPDLPVHLEIAPGISRLSPKTGRICFRTIQIVTVYELADMMADTCRRSSTWAIRRICYRMCTLVDMAAPSLVDMMVTSVQDEFIPPSACSERQQQHKAVNDFLDAVMRVPIDGVPDPEHSGEEAGSDDDDLRPFLGWHDR